MLSKIRQAKAKDGGTVIIHLSYRYAQVVHIKDEKTIFNSGNLCFSQEAEKIYKNLRKY